MKQKLDWTQNYNKQLEDENEKLRQRCAELEKDQEELNRKREEIAKMVIESQANKEEIEKLYNENKNKADKMNELSMEVHVVVTEKMTVKKELDRVDANFRKVKNDYKSQRSKFEILNTENTQLT